MEETEEQRVDEENYFVSMTDMMVGLVFIFIIMLMYFALQLQQSTKAQEAKTQDLSVVTAQLQHDKEEARQQIQRVQEANDQLEGVRKARDAILDAVAAQMKQQGIVVQVDKTQGLIRFQDQVLFERGDAEVRRSNPNGVSGEETLRLLGGVLENVLRCYVDNRSAPTGRDGCTDPSQSVESLLIEGHTDIDGTRESNWILSANRAINTYRKLTEFSPHLLDLCHRGPDGCFAILGVSGYGPDRPVRPGADEASKSQNRRIDLRILMAAPNLDAIQADLDAQEHRP